MILYKYLAPGRTDVLRGCRIRFTQPSALNDPFELRPFFEKLFPDTYLKEQIAGKTIDIDPLIDKACDQVPEHLRRSISREDLLVLMKQIIESDMDKGKIQDLVAAALTTLTDAAQKVAPKVREQMIQTMGSQVGILSLSEIPDSTLMWSHYGGQHRGFLIGFDSNHPFFDRRRSKDDEFYHLRRVRYQSPMVYDSLLDLDGEKAFLVKSPEWAYELEWRILAPITDATEVIPLPDPIALFEFPPTTIVEVVVGARSNSQLRTEIEGILQSKAPYSHAQLKCAVLDEAAGVVRIS
jgi:hypothetical protein